MNENTNSISRWKNAIIATLLLVTLVLALLLLRPDDSQSVTSTVPEVSMPDLPKANMAESQTPAPEPPPPPPPSEKEPRTMAAKAPVEKAPGLMTSVREFDVLGNGDETVNIQRAIDSGKSLFWPEGTYTFSKDLYVRANTSWTGSGYATHLLGNGAGVRVDASPVKANVSNWRIADMRLGRKGTAGTTLFLGGSDIAGNNYAAIRGVVESIWIDECNGHGIEMAVAYIIDLQSIYIRNCRQTAYYFHTGEGGKVAANAIKIFGGELQNNGKAVELNDTSGISFFGTTIEGNTLGVDLPKNARQTSFFGSYFEANGGYDISAGSVSNASGLMVSGGVFWDGGSKIKSGKIYSIQLHKAIGVDIQGVSFSGYSSSKDEAVPQPSGAIAILDNPNWVTGTFQNINLFDTPDPLVVTRKYKQLKFYDVNLAIENSVIK